MIQDMKSKISYDDYVQVILKIANAYTEKEFEETTKAFEPLLKEPVDWNLYIENYDYLLSDFLLEMLLIQYDINIYCETIDNRMIEIDITDYKECQNQEQFWDLMNKLNYTVTNDPRK